MYLFFSLSLLLLAQAPPTLESRLEPLIASHKGTVAVGVQNLMTGEAWYHEGDAVSRDATRSASRAPRGVLATPSRNEAARKTRVSPAALLRITPWDQAVWRMSASSSRTAA